jgi:ATP-dependent DNA helicase RecG
MNDSFDNVLKKLLQQGESQTLEFKTSFGREAMETLVAFANANGGTLVVGVNNKQKVVGVSRVIVKCCV